MKQLEAAPGNARSALAALGPDWLGSISASPSGPVVAGSYVTWTLTYTSGVLGVDDGGAIMVATRQISDWGAPQTQDAGAANYVSTTTTGDATVKAEFTSRASVRPWRQCIVVSVTDGHLGPGDTVTITIGDTSGGGPGLHAQTFPERAFELRPSVDCFGSGDFLPLQDKLTWQIVPGDAARIELLGPSTARVGEPGWLFVRALDRWGNVAPGYRGTVELVDPSGSANLPGTLTFDADDRGFHRFEGVVLNQEGTHRLKVVDREAGYTATANPCVCVAAGSVGLSLYWGDPHGQSEETVGTGSVRDYWRFIRNEASVDFGGHCGNDFQISPAFYRELREIVQQYHEPGRFVSFLSYEWSGNHTAGGDHNVYFLHDDPERSQIHRSGHWLLSDTSEMDTDRYPVSRLRDEFRGREDVLIIPHVGGRRSLLSTVDDVCQSPVIEILSVWGRFPWHGIEALELGLKVGFIGGSDDHSGRPGIAPPANNQLIQTGGLTAIYAPELTRGALWDGLKTRHCYGSSGARIIVSVDVDGHVMGEEYEASGAVRLSGRVAGTAPVERIELRRGADVIWEYDTVSSAAPEWSEALTRGRLRVSWTGARGKNRNKVTRWDGGLTLEGGRILGVEPYDLSHPSDGVTEWDEQGVQWRSRTSGDVDGVTLELEMTAVAVLRVDTPSLREAITLRAVGDTARVLDAGAVGQQVELRWVRSDTGPLDVEWAHVDESPERGTNAYWVWITQADGECAWSSPVFAERP